MRNFFVQNICNFFYKFSAFFLQIFDDNLLSGVLNISTHAKIFLNVFFFMCSLLAYPPLLFLRVEMITGQFLRCTIQLSHNYETPFSIHDKHHLSTQLFMHSICPFTSQNLTPPSTQMILFQDILLDTPNAMQYCLEELLYCQLLKY